MSSEQHGAGTAGAGGSGRLADVIATRGGLAAPEAPFVIEHREALIYMLCEAAELEHGIMCQYLFAAFSIKQAADEGLTARELEAVTRWRKQISRVATQEMLHLALVHNLLSAIGAAPHMVRPNMPAPASHYPAGVQLSLMPFGEQALRHFMFLERPEGMELEDAEGMTAMGLARPMMSERDIVPRGQDFATVGHLYRSIEAGLDHLAEKHSEEWLFVGPSRAQATAAHFGWPELVPVTDLASAHRAIDEILEQGEGPRGHWRQAHFGKFVEILDEYNKFRAAKPDFEPTRRVMAANVRQPERATDVQLISDPLTARVSDLFNVAYEILLQIFERFFAHTEETDPQLKTLADATVALMLQVIKPLGDLITTLPVGTDYPGMMAGPSFELFYESDYLMPHREAAWSLLAERLDDAAWLCDALQTGRGKAISSQLEPVLGAIRGISRNLAAHLPAHNVHSRLATEPASLSPDQLDALGSQASELADRVSLSQPAQAGHGRDRELADLFRLAHSICADAVAGDRCDAAQQAQIVPRLLGSVLRPLADIIAAGHAGASRTEARPGAAAVPEQAGPPESVRHDEAASTAERLWEAARTATRIRSRLGRSGACPPELAEAVAGLQDLALALGGPAGLRSRVDEFRKLQGHLPAGIQTARNGPYLVTNVPRITDHLGNDLRLAPQLALCRCGASAIKPLCDGSCATVGFTDDKDPKRVDDRRDTYAGTQLTIYDNRGICQHSGFCSDRLSAVFRSGSDPFVAPSGGRMDEIIRAVRDCPSGALSYGIDGTEARAQVDWHDVREPCIEVTKDGPYRVTGKIPLTDAHGDPVGRNEGSSLEHYAVCRCGHSQNKPFCSGMHYYVDFKDPVDPPGYEPTLFEWAGGLPALARMARLLYEKHVPADSLLASTYAAAPPGQPRLLARWLAEAFGGPARDGSDGSTLRQIIGVTSGDFGEEHRARWVALASAAADDAKLPADPGFRSALASCLDWASRTALAVPREGASDATPVPRWEWGPGGPPISAGTGRATGDAKPADVQLPGPDETVQFGPHIKPLFREQDRKSMSFAFDLWSYDDVRAHASAILARLRDGSMPCDAGWPADRIDVFSRWIDSGTQP